MKNSNLFIGLGIAMVLIVACDKTPQTTDEQERMAKKLQSMTYTKDIPPIKPGQNEMMFELKDRPKQERKQLDRK